jgi:ferric-dicitrate binding protein FerR (iron transport regulator)
MSAFRLIGIMALGICTAMVTMFAPLTSHAQLNTGASLTVLRGSAAVLKADGSPLSPAPTGLMLGVNDQVATLAGSGALVTFFDGSEIELGSDAAIIIREMSRQGTSLSFRIESIVGSSVHRVIQFTDPVSYYLIETPNTVAAVRGTEFGHRRDPAGDVSVAVADGTVDFPGSGQQLGPGERRWVTPSGAVQNGKFPLGSSLFNAVAEDVSSGGSEGQEDESDREEKERKRDKRRGKN